MSNPTVTAIVSTIATASAMPYPIGIVHLGETYDDEGGTRLLSSIIHEYLDSLGDPDGRSPIVTDDVNRYECPLPVAGMDCHAISIDQSYNTVTHYYVTR